MDPQIAEAILGHWYRGRNVNDRYGRIGDQELIRAIDGMTFDHGDYARIEEIPEKEKIAEKLYAKALTYDSNPWAYLGLGILKQKVGDHTGSIDILSKGVDAFPDSIQLNLCLGISYMNTGAFDKALSHFLPFQSSKEALGFIVSCYEALGDADTASRFRRKLESVSIR